MPEPHNYTSYSFRTNGNVSLKERGEQTRYGSWSSSDLVEVDVADLELIVSMGDDDDDAGKDEISISLSDYHVEHESNGRAFHAHLTAYLTLQNAEMLHAYLGFLIANHGT